MEKLKSDGYPDQFVVDDLESMACHISTAMILGYVDEFCVGTCVVRDPKTYKGSRHCVFLHDHVRVAAMVGLAEFQNGWLTGFDVRWVGTLPEFRGRKLAVKLYTFLINQGKSRLWSGSQQTPDGRRLWVNLFGVPGIRLRIVSPKFIEDVLYGKSELRGEEHPLYEGKHAEETRLLAFSHLDPIGPWLDQFRKISVDQSILRQV